jgi:hypothetical protein
MRSGRQAGASVHVRGDAGTNRPPRTNTPGLPQANGRQAAQDFWREYQTPPTPPSSRLAEAVIDVLVATAAVVVAACRTLLALLWLKRPLFTRAASSPTDPTNPNATQDSPKPQRTTRYPFLNEKDDSSSHYKLKKMIHT